MERLIFRNARLVVLAMLMLCTLNVHAQQSRPKPVAATDVSKQAPTSIPVKCVDIRDLGVIARFSRDRDQDQKLVTTGASRSACANSEVQGDALTGAGDLLVVVDKKSYDEALAVKRDGDYVLYLNGVALPTDATILAREAVGDEIVLRYRLRQGAELQRLWSMIWSDKGLFDKQDLNVAIVWTARGSTEPAAVPPRAAASGAQPQVQITTGDKLTLALGVIGVLLIVTILVGISSDALRDSGASWWSEAKLWWKTAKKLPPADVVPFLTAMVPTYTAANNPDYERLAQYALSGAKVAEDKIKETQLGLALLVNKWRPVRASYSLSRVQLALWFSFAVMTALFLWLLYGDLRRIDGSLLQLLGISIGTAGLSWAADRNAGTRPYLPSQGFLLDIVSGFDEQSQLHRYQAVVVNVLLLAVGIDHVVQHLAYPVFDGTWLIFLGISGAAYGVGKQLVENKAT